MSDYLAEALDMFSAEDIAGALKDEIPLFRPTNTRVMRHFKGEDKSDLDACILCLKDEEKLQQEQQLRQLRHAMCYRPR